jgi:hypothetical protein
MNEIGSIQKKNEKKKNTIHGHINAHTTVRSSSLIK